MILQWSETLVQKAAELENLTKLAQDRNQLEQKLKVLQKHVTRLRASLQSLQVLREAGIAPVTADIQDQHARQLLRSTMDEFAQRPSILLEEGTFTALTKALDVPAAGLEQQIRAHWEAYIKRTAPSLQDDVLRALERLPAFGDAVRRLRGLQDMLQTRRNTPPASLQDLAAYQNAVQEMGATWQSLSSSDITAEVLTFLREAGGQGASLTAYTADVQAWLHTHGIIDAFRIRVKG